MQQTIPSKLLKNIRSRRKSEFMMIAMHKNQPSLNIKNPKKNNIQHQKSKTFENKMCKRIDGVRKFTVKSTTNPYERFRCKKNEVCGPRCVRKAISKPTFIDTSQKRNRNKELHFCTLQRATPGSSSASLSVEQSINNYSLFSKETENKRSFTSDKVEFSQYIYLKKSKN